MKTVSGMVLVYNFESHAEFAEYAEDVNQLLTLRSLRPLRAIISNQDTTRIQAVGQFHAEAAEYAEVFIMNSLRSLGTLRDFF